MPGTPSTLVRGFSAVAALVATLPWPAAAQIEHDKLILARNAAASFVELAKGSQTSGEAPRLSDPAVKQLLDAVFDARDVEAARSVPFTELSGLSERMVTGVKIGAVYMLAGTGATDLSELGGGPDAGRKVNLNIVKFAPEMGRFFDFQIRIQGAVVEAVLTRLSTARPEDLARANFRSGLADIRDGSARSVAGVIETIAVNGLSDAWRRERLSALSAIAPRLARFLEAQQKSELRQVALAGADVMDDADVKAGLQAFAKIVAAE
jgi:hypothetical protein